MWGRPVVFCLLLNALRNTPTHVGKTWWASTPFTTGWKHPHACGEDPRLAEGVRHGPETPPRMWGRRAAASGSHRSTGNTPTHVGKTSIKAGIEVPGWKHPHACGEDRPDHNRAQEFEETPPRMWGRLASEAQEQAAVRNTPTHVGKTGRYGFKDHENRKHPHACGEDDNVLLQCADSVETPPRMWGRLALDLTKPNPNGNTPTHVGKTSAK